MNIQALTGSKPILDDDHDILSPREDLVEDFRQQIQWRQKKASQYPDDDRNRKAIEIFEKLAATVADVDDVLILQYDQLLDDLPDDEYHDFRMRRVGFSYEPNPISATQFLLDFCAGYKSGDWKK
jgi:hypothetical protein